MSHIIIDKPEARYDNQRLNGEVALTIGEGENAVIVGPNGSGKSLLATYINGGISLKSGSVKVLRPDGTEVPRMKIASLSFRDIYRMGGASQDNYYQKRWQATENEESPVVGDALGRAKLEYHRDLLDAVGVTPLLEKRVIFLSSGELRKLMIVRSLMSQPELLIVDNPYIGLDAASRVTINDVLSDVAQKLGIKVLLLISHPKDMPEWVDTIIGMKDNRVAVTTTRQQFLSDTELRGNLFAEESLTAESLPTLPADMRAVDDGEYADAIVMNKVKVEYPPVTILRDLDWTVKRGEKWALLGKNGCGKSTLLSLVCGDNPQGYANDITLFGRRRGSGESIWDIKSHIGYISPDMHTFYQADIPCLDVVASGFFDTVGLYRKPNDAQRALAMEWMKRFHCENLADRSFLKTSYGEQRIVMLTRVFVKRPSLVILDEPLHGLDAGKKNLAKLLIESYCDDPSVTLIYVTHYEEEIPSVVDKRKTLVKIKN